MENTKMTQKEKSTASPLFNEIQTILDFEFIIKKNIQSWHTGKKVNPKLKDIYQKYIDLFNPFVLELEKLNKQLYAPKEVLKTTNKALNLTAVMPSLYDYDKRGVRAFVRYAKSSGGWAIECYRKKRKDESKGDHDWQMVREGHIQSYSSREEAERKVLKLAKQVCLENGY